MPDDTLYFIFEEDFEFTDSAAERRRRDTVSAAAGASSSSAMTPEPPQKKLRAPPLQRDAAPSPSCRTEDWKSTFARDLSILCTAAFRAKVGDFVWLGYQPENCWKKSMKSGEPNPRFGSHAVAVSKRGAALILEGLKQSQPDDIDVFFRNWTAKLAAASGSVSFVWPPVGGFWAHMTECCPDQVKVREPFWESKWSCQGTRPSHDPQSRPKQIRRYKPNGKGTSTVAAELKEQDFVDSVRYCWRTRVPPTLGRAETGSERQVRAARRAKTVQEAFRRFVKTEKEACYSVEKQIFPGALFIV